MQTTGYGRSTGEPGAAHEAPIVYVVDSDTSVAESLDVLSGAQGWRVQAAGSAEEFLDRAQVVAPCCLLVDADLPGLSALDLQQILAGRAEMPIIFMSAHTDIQTVVQAMKAGAFEFLVKPRAGEDIVATLAAAIDHSRQELRTLARVRSLEERYQSLSNRERDVMRLVVAGRLNKQVGLELGISIITVKSHRGRVMRKMRARSFMELFAMAAGLRLSEVAEGV